MAKVGFSAIVSQVSGKVGGAVFTRARNGATLRTRVRGRNPRSDAQSGVRESMTLASRAFKGISAADLALWNTYAAAITLKNAVSGSSYHPSAINAFNKLAAKFLQITPGGVIPVVPPAVPFTGDAVAVTAVGGAGEVTFTGSADNGANIKTEVLLQPLASANRTPSPNGYRHEGFTAIPMGTPLIISHLNADYLHPASPIPAGHYVPAYRFVKTTTGEATGLTVLPAVAVT